MFPLLIKHVICRSNILKMFSHKPLEHRCMPSHASSHTMACLLWFHPMIQARIQRKVAASPREEELVIFYLVVS
jgi:hypothetical protein